MSENIELKEDCVVTHDDEKENSDEAAIREALGENVEFVELDDEIRFKCIQCGACCIGRNDIMLNSFDVYTLSKHFNMDPVEFLEKYTNCFPGGNTQLPVVVLNQNPKNKFCTFLKYEVSEDKFYCTVNDAKPAVCKNHPIGVARGIHKDNPDDMKVKYMKVPMCPNHKEDVEPVTVGEFIKDYQKTEEESKAAYKVQLAVCNVVDMKTLAQVLGLFLSISNDLIKAFKSLPQAQRIRMDSYFNRKLEENEVDNVEPSFLKVIEMNKETAQDTFMHLVADISYCLYANFDINLPYLDQTDKMLSDIELLKEDIAKFLEHIKGLAESYARQLKLFDILRTLDNDKDNLTMDDYKEMFETILSLSKEKQEENSEEE